MCAEVLLRIAASWLQLLLFEIRKFDKYASKFINICFLLFAGFKVRTLNGSLRILIW